MVDGRSPHAGRWRCEFWSVHCANAKKLHRWQTKRLHGSAKIFFSCSLWHSWAMYLMLGLTIFSLKWIVNDFPGLRSVVLLITQAFTASISMWRMAMRKIEKYFQCTEWKGICTEWKGICTEWKSICTGCQGWVWVDVAGTGRRAWYQTWQEGKNRRKNRSATLAIVFHGGTNLDIVAQDTLPCTNWGQWVALIFRTGFFEMFLTRTLRYCTALPSVRSMFDSRDYVTFNENLYSAKSCNFSSQKTTQNLTKKGSFVVFTSLEAEE